MLSTNLDGVDRTTADETDKSDEALLAPVRAQGSLTSAADAADILRGVAEKVRAWFADSGYPTKAYVTWHDSTRGWSDDPENRAVRRRYSRVTFIVHDPAADVTGKAGACIADGLDTMDEAMLREAYERATAQTKRLASSVSLPGDLGALVFGPRAAGTFVHEVVGHLCEADNAYGSGAPRLGQRLTRVPMRVVDGPQRPGDWGWVDIDDEGVRTRLTTIVDDGVAVDYLHNRRSAGSGDSNGHGLRATFRDRVYPRLSQIGIDAGVDAPEDLIASVRSGVYIDSLGYGYLNPSKAQVRLIIREAYLISDGVVTDTVIGGGEFRWDAYQALQAVVGIGSDQAWTPALCLKRRQELPVLNGGATLLLDLAALTAGQR